MFSFLKRSRKPLSANRKVKPFRPTFEALEDRQLLSASAVSNLMNQTVQFNLRDDGHLLMTRGGVQTDVGSGVQGLYQGKDAAGDQVAFDWSNNLLNEYTPNHAWVVIGRADQVTQDASNDVFFTRGGTLSLATGIPDRVPGAVPILSNVQGLVASGGHTSVQVGSLVKADLTVSFDVASGAATVGFANVQLNVGGFVNTVVSEMQSFTKPLQNLADRLTEPLLNQSWASSLTPINVLKMLGYNTTSAQTFADAVHAINHLSSTGGGWVPVGDFTAQIPGGSVSASFPTAPDLSAVTAALQPLKALQNEFQGFRVALDDAHELVNLLTGKTANLFSYTLNVYMRVADFDQRLATLPVSPETATEVDLDLIGNVSLSGGATFGFDSTGLQSGNLARGFYVQGANVGATLTLGLAGTVNEAYLVGYRLTGEVVGTVTISLPGKVYADQLLSGSVHPQASDSVQLKLVTQTLGPKDLIGKYLTPEAAAAAAKAFKAGANAAGDALRGAYNNAAAQTANALSGVGKTAGAMATALHGLYNQQAADTAQIINNLDTAATAALNNGAATLGRVGAHILSDASKSVNDIAGVLHGVYNQQADRIAGVLHGLQVGTSDIGKALQNLGATGDTIAAALSAGCGMPIQTAANVVHRLGMALSNFTWDSAGHEVQTLYQNGKAYLQNTWDAAGNYIAQAMWNASGSMTSLTKWAADGGKVFSGWVNSAGQWLEQDLSGGKVLAERLYQGAQQLYAKAWDALGNMTSLTRWAADGGKVFSGWVNSAGQWLEQDISNGRVVAERLYQGAQQLYSRVWDAAGNYLGDIGAKLNPLNWHL